jgi:hypothetical protein
LKNEIRSQNPAKHMVHTRLHQTYDEAHLMAKHSFWTEFFLVNFT